MSKLDLPHPWNVYQDVQNRLAQSGRVTGQAWGLEAALDRVLDACQVEGNTTPISQCSINTSINTASCRERSHLRQRLRYKAEFPSNVESPYRSIAARGRLAAVREQVCPQDWKLLLLLGYGFSHNEIATAMGQTASATRTRICRVRARLHTP